MSKIDLSALKAHFTNTVEALETGNGDGALVEDNCFNLPSGNVLQISPREF